MIYKEWPVLEAKAKTGKTKSWLIRVLEKENHSMSWIEVETEWWQENGGHQTAQKSIQGKNYGKANETSDLEQAVKEAEAEFKKQKDAGYREEGEIIESYPLPMLAHDFKKQGHRIQFPCDGQPKLDGIRALYQESLGFWSRQGKLFPAKCVEHLKLNTLITIDGELILPKPYTFQQTCSAVKKYNPELSPKLEYHIFDVVIKDYTWWNRARILSTFKENETVKVVPIFELENVEAAQKKMEELILDGYEGLMLRNYKGDYVFNQRSADLQKFKEFMDDEFTVVDVVDGEGREKGAAIFVCCLPNQNTVKVRPQGSYEQRQKWFRNKRSLIGKQATIRFQGWTDDNSLRFPVMTGFRDYE